QPSSQTAAEGKGSMPRSCGVVSSSDASGGAALFTEKSRVVVNTSRGDRLLPRPTRSRCSLYPKAICVGWPMGMASIAHDRLFSTREAQGLDFQLTSEQQRLQNICRELAADFATRAAAHDRDASHPVENYERLREEGFLALTVGKEWGGWGASFLDHTLAY